ncbi:MAG: 6,7-dimethyl-8-ribityllumazine synthase [Verrucomicrobiae bacterium]|nr:6,7-dimethyl-8-ribityllumazine synthase [Verrucomicrobiae bacterium]
MLTANEEIIPDAKGLRFAIIASLYNRPYTDGLLFAAEEVFVKAHARHVKIVRVPGSFEIPVAAAKCARSGKFDAVINLGVIFVGQTLHADHIGLGITLGLTHLAVETGIPQIHEVLIVKTPAEARKRCLNPKYNKGTEAALAAVQIAGTLKKI